MPESSARPTEYAIQCGDRYVRLVAHEGQLAAAKVRELDYASTWPSATEAILAAFEVELGLDAHRWLVVPVKGRAA